MVRLTSSTLMLSTALLLLAGCGAPENEGKQGDPCRTQTDCGPGLVCDCTTLTCVPVGQASPGCDLPDAQPPDASTIDAALPDSATDATAADGALPDGATTDGGETDALIEDAQTGDASP
jgi:hypothetical protein